MDRNSKERISKPKVALVGDGQTERMYFYDVKETDRPSDLDLFPDLPTKAGSYKGVLAKANKLTSSYDRVYALIDMDKVISDGTEAQYLIEKKAAVKNGVTVLENNPCFEFWLLLHFIKTSKSFTGCDDVIAELQKKGRIPGYGKSQQFQLGTRLYASFKDLIRDHAIPNAKLLEENRPIENKHYPRSESFRFFEWYQSENRIALLRQ
ncbi:RloB family protein [Puia sp.]|jgi:hypothetical protein|uniref:RloB family protein n=1 Tax=Puia sp. TaxID=2045100 RepID=UPI002F40299C